MPSVRAQPPSLGQRPNQGRSPLSNIRANGGAEPRLTSGGEAGVDGVKFQGSAPKVKTYLTSGGTAGVNGIKFQGSAPEVKMYLTSGGEAGVDGVKFRIRSLELIALVRMFNLGIDPRLCCWRFSFGPR
jgi:hypothetical protein